MATALKNLSDYDSEQVPSAEDMQFCIMVSDWNKEITHSLLRGAVNTLKNHGVDENNIQVHHVPGSFELVAAGKYLAEYTWADAVICLGCVIQGETPHFQYVCQGVTHGITELNLKYEIPFIFGVLTTNTQQQAIDRAGGKHGNKGDEAAFTAIKMVALKREIKSHLADI